MEERYNLAIDRMKAIIEEKTVAEPYREYFQHVARFILKLDELKRNVESGKQKEMSEEELQEEMNYLKTVREKEVADLIKEARSFGDLSENSEYDEAKNTQGLVENRITELEQTIKNAVIIDESELSVDNVSVGTHVTIRETGEDEAEEYDIVGRTEADAFNGKISDESPVGHALMGKAVGDKAEVLLPTGQTVVYTVLAITHSAN